MSAIDPLRHGDLAHDARLDRIRGPLVTVGALSAATVALHLRDPHHHGSWGLCPLYAVTGIYCPGCGGLRAVNDLTDGHIGSALSSNVLITAAIPFVALLLAVWLVTSWRGTAMPSVPPAVRRALTWAGVSAAVAFTILRNTPAGAWLAP